jgi:hypothetical protein
MYTCFGKCCNITGNEFLILEVVAVEGIFIPVQDGLQNRDVAGCFLDLVIGNTLVFTGCCVWIVLSSQTQILLY